MREIPKTEEEWKKILTSEQYKILRGRGTEAPDSGALLHEKGKGTYNCTACGNPLFSSDAKFDSGTGWPSFDKAIEGAVIQTPDNSGGMRRVEITCVRCGSHLGHVFNDGPTETGARFCTNSLSLEMVPEVRP